MSVKALFLDVGGVLLTSDWGHVARLRAARHFNLDFDELNRRHHETFHLYEEGRLSLSEYLDGAVFHQDRPFTRVEFRSFMLAQSQPHADMIELARRLKAVHGLRIVAISNEGSELARYRIDEFDLKTLVDDFIFSCFVGRRKPDPEIYQLALNITQVSPEAIVYVEENPMFVAAAENLGLHGVCHSGIQFTRKALATMGLA